MIRQEAGLILVISSDAYSPQTRSIMPRKIGKVVAIAQVGGLHRRYERLAA